MPEHRSMITWRLCQRIWQNKHLSRHHGRDSHPRRGTMKALIKGGVCVALSWLASGASAQELPVKWQAAGAKNSNPAVVAPASKVDANSRPVTLSMPTPLGGAPPGTGTFAPIIPAQAADDKNAPPLPKVEIY